MLRNNRKRVLTHGKCGNKITVQRDDGAALSLRIVLFFQRSAVKLYTCLLYTSDAADEL